MDLENSKSTKKPRRDPIEVMSEMFDNFENYARRAEVSEHNSVSYRLNLLWIHATAAILIAPLFAATGRNGMRAPSFQVLLTIPGAPGSIALILGVSGFILGVGCVLRHKKMEIVGLFGLVFWYLIIVFSFGGAVVNWYVAGSSPNAVPSLYAPVLYLHFAVIMVAHMVNLIRARRLDRRFGDE